MKRIYVIWKRILVRKGAFVYNGVGYVVIIIGAEPFMA
jgi:hypothetical protein